MHSILDVIVERAARALCIKDGLKPDEMVLCSHGDDFTMVEAVQARVTAFGAPLPGHETAKMVPQWRRYRWQASVASPAISNAPISSMFDPVGLRFGYSSHIGQDQWVAEVFDHRSPGFFLDFGAFDGVEISNTYFLERALGWRGICVEPNPTFYPKLCAARSSVCINAALWTESRKSISFVDAHGLSTFEHLKSADINAQKRAKAIKRVIAVDTINATELLDRFLAPRVIDYMSLDVEGAELDVLKSIDLEKYVIVLMTVEHNESGERQEAVGSYLKQFGYVRRQHRNDDFFYKETFPVPNDPFKVLERISTTYPIKA